MVIHPVVTILDTIAFLLVTTDLYGDKVSHTFVSRNIELDSLHLEWKDFLRITIGTFISLFGLLIAALLFTIALRYFMMSAGFVDISKFHDHSQIMNNPHMDALLIGLFSLCFMSAGFRVYKFGVDVGAAIWILILYKLLARPLKRGMLVLGATVFIISRVLDAST